MNVSSSPIKRWLAVAIFAIAMAWVESAVVYDLRTFVNRIEPYQPDPLPLIGKLGPVELVRELATLIMLFTVGVIAGNTWPARWGYTAIAFGIWDIFYYVFQCRPNSPAIRDFRSGFPKESRGVNENEFKDF